MLGFSYRLSIPPFIPKLWNNKPTINKITLNIVRRLLVIRQIPKNIRIRLINRMNLKSTLLRIDRLVQNIPNLFLYLLPRLGRTRMRS